jgi:hypothetical protein
MSAITGNDPAAYRTYHAMLPCGTKFARETGGPAMQGDVDKARTMLAAAGYKGEKVVVISPSDFPTIGPLGEVTNDILTKIGINVEFVSTDWGTVTQRRASREPVERGGWSIVHTWYPSNIGATPVEQFFIRGPWPVRLVRLVWRRGDRAARARIAGRPGSCYGAGRRRRGTGAGLRPSAFRAARPVPDPDCST